MDQDYPLTEYLFFLINLNINLQRLSSLPYRLRPLFLPSVYALRSSLLLNPNSFPVNGSLVPRRAKFTVRLNSYPSSCTDVEIIYKIIQIYHNHCKFCYRNNVVILFTRDRHTLPMRGSAIMALNSVLFAACAFRWAPI